MTKSGGDHFRSLYVLEAWLWLNAIRSPLESGKLNKVRYLKRLPDLGLGGRKHLTSAILVLENLYDQQGQQAQLISELGAAVQSVKRTQSFDLYLLFLLASTRCMARLKQLPLATVLLAEYISESNRVSFGETSDVLGIAPDLMAKPWSPLRNDSYQEIKEAG